MADILRNEDATGSMTGEQAKKLYNRDERIAITVWHDTPEKAMAGRRCIRPKHRSNDCAVRD
jgi:hypothetical protein